MYLPRYAFYDRLHSLSYGSEVELFQIPNSKFWEGVDQNYGIINLKLTPSINGFNINEIFRNLSMSKIKDYQNIVDLINVNNTILLINDGYFIFCYNEKYENAWLKDLDKTP